MSHKIGEEVTIANCGYAQMLGLVGVKGIVIENNNPEFDYKVKIEKYTYDNEYLNENELE